MIADLDVEGLRRKYAEERDKRLSQGNRTVIDPLAVFPELREDPWAEPIERDSITEDLDVVITGAGIAGLLAAVRLTKAGIDKVRNIDVAGDFGGVWYWNRYPGIRCDVESYVYLPLIEEVGTVPTERYATGEEIRRHCRAVAEKYDLPRRALLQTRITEARWDAATARWIVRTNRGDVLRSRFLIATSGFQHFPKIPSIPGMETFKGRMFHPSRWDFGYTGGTPAGNLSGLADKTVTLVGTGATGIQILPHLARDAAKVLLVQRTPAAVNARNNRPTDTDWFRAQPAGWQQQRMDNFQAVTGGGAYETDLLDDCWTRETRKLSEATRNAAPAEAAAAYERADLALMEELRARVDAIVADPEKAARLKPWYSLFCKRPLFADDYLETLNQPNVELVDTEGAGIERITETGFMANGQHYDTDCIVLASGFEVGAYEKRSASFPIIGRAGRSLADKWDEEIRSLHGLWIHEFPNFQIVGTVYQSTSGFNYTWLADHQARHATALIGKALTEGWRSIEVDSEAEKRWAELLQTFHTPDDFFANCTPGYFNNEGDSSRKALYTTTFGGGYGAYLDILSEWREGGFRKDCQITT